MKSKIISLMAVLFLGVSLFSSSTQAVSIFPEQDLICDTTKIFEEICYQNNLMSIPYAVTYIKGEEFPIYCENQEKPGVSFALAYTVRTQSTLKNTKIQKIMEVGYPNCSIESLGAWNSIEAYVITQLAIFDIYYHYDLNKFTPKENANISENFISNMITFIEKCRKIDCEQTYPEITIDENNIQWQEENENFYSKTYEIKSNEKLENYYVEILEGPKNEIFIANKQNDKRNQFLQDEKFKILIPKGKNLSFQIQVRAEIDVPSVIVGKAFDHKMQDYFFSSDVQILTEKLYQEYYAKLEEIDDTINIPIEKEEEKPQKVISQFVKTEKKEYKILPQTGM